jgi:hypothetical protein
LPEVLEGNNMVVKIATVASRASVTLLLPQPPFLLLPEVLEGNNNIGNILKNFNNSISK